MRLVYSNTTAWPTRRFPAPSWAGVLCLLSCASPGSHQSFHPNENFSVRKHLVYYKGGRHDLRARTKIGSPKSLVASGDVDQRLGALLDRSNKRRHLGSQVRFLYTVHRPTEPYYASAVLRKRTVTTDPIICLSKCCNRLLSPSHFQSLYLKPSTACDCHTSWVFSASIPLYGPVSLQHLYPLLDTADERAREYPHAEPGLLSPSCACHRAAPYALRAMPLRMPPSATA